MYRACKQEENETHEAGSVRSWNTHDSPGNTLRETVHEMNLSSVPT
jgi:hypothetical protein